MTFDASIPQPNDFLSDSQSDIQVNFNSSNVIIGVNHVNFDNSLPAIGTLGYLTNVADEGKHTIVHTKMVNSVTAAPATLADEGAIYAKEVALGGRVEAYYRYPTSGATPQLTAIKAWVRFKGDTAAANPYDIPVGEINSQYNIASIRRTATGLYTLTFTTALTDANYTVLVSPKVSGNPVVGYLNTAAVGSFTIRVQETSAPTPNSNSPIINVVVIGN